MPGHHRQYSELISAAIATGGPHIARSSAVKLMRAVRAFPHVCTCHWESGGHLLSCRAGLQGLLRVLFVMLMHLMLAAYNGSFGRHLGCTE